MKYVNVFLLAGDKFMPEIHLKPFTKNKERTQKFKEIGHTSYITKMNLIRLVFNMIWRMEILKIQKEEELLIIF